MPPEAGARPVPPALLALQSLCSAGKVLVNPLSSFVFGSNRPFLAVPQVRTASLLGRIFPICKKKKRKKDSSTVSLRIAVPLLTLPSEKETHCTKEILLFIF